MLLGPLNMVARVLGSCVCGSVASPLRSVRLTNTAVVYIGISAPGNMWGSPGHSLQRLFQPGAVMNRPGAHGTHRLLDAA